MSGGLKQQWGVGNPAQVGPDAQSQDFKTAFEKAMDATAEHLQYTAANGDRSRHDPLATRSEALVPRYQDALKEVDAADPAKAKPSIDTLLADTDSLGQEVATFRSETEKSVNEWQSRSGPYDAAVKQVEELSEWQHPKEAAVRALADAIRGMVNDHAYDKAVSTADQFLPKLQPVYEDLQKQKAAKQQYEPALAALQPRLAQAAAPSFAKLAGQQSEIASSQSAMESSAQGKDFVAAVAASTALSGRVDNYSEQLKQIQQAKDQFDQVSPGVQTKLQSAQNPSPFKKLEAMQAELSNGQKDMASAVTAEEFEQALQKANDLGTKADNYSEQLKQIQQAKDQFDQALGALQPRLAKAAERKYPKLEPMQKEIADLQKPMEERAQAENYEEALKLGAALSVKLDAYDGALAKASAPSSEGEANAAAAGKGSGFQPGQGSGSMPRKLETLDRNGEPPDGKAAANNSNLLGSPDDPGTSGSSVLNNPAFKKQVEEMEADGDAAHEQWTSQTTDGVLDFLRPATLRTKYNADGTACVEAQKDFNAEWNKISFTKTSADPVKLLAAFKIFSLRISALQQSNSRIKQLIFIDCAGQLKIFGAFVLTLAKDVLALGLKGRVEALAVEAQNAANEVTQAEVKQALNLFVSALTLVIFPEGALAKMAVSIGAITVHVIIDNELGHGTAEGKVVFIAADGAEVAEGLGGQFAVAAERLGTAGKKGIGVGGAVLTAVLDQHEINEGHEKVEHLRKDIESVQKAFNQLMAGVTPLVPKFLEQEKAVKQLNGLIAGAMSRANDAAKKYDAIEQEIQKAIKEGK